MGAPDRLGAPSDLGQVSPSWAKFWVRACFCEFSIFASAMVLERPYEPNRLAEFRKQSMSTRPFRCFPIPIPLHMFGSAHL